MYPLIRRLLFLAEPEKIHYWTMRRLQFASRRRWMRRLLRKMFVVADPALETEVFGIRFPNPVGLAAGFDKDGKYTDALACLGFGFIEIGTVTPRPQPGNPKPRLFRLPADQALINRMGFNNEGVSPAALRLSHRKENVVVGGNIGKNKDTPNEDAVADYETCFRELYPVVDYFVVNVSSPNTPGLRALQEKEPLMRLLERIQEQNRATGNPKPLLLKIAPDLTEGQLDDIIAIVRETGISGIVATNTTIDRSGLQTAQTVVDAAGAGGLSGKPLRARATEVIRYISRKSGGTIPIIAAGGIFTAEDALEKLRAGASLVQVYTGFIYEGPMIVKKICKGLLKARQ
jgi:dihydroorotate dehydrogenase